MKPTKTEFFTRGGKRYIKRDGYIDCELVFAVITEVPPEYSDGNKYDAMIEPMDIRWDLMNQYKYLNIPPDANIHFKARVFEIGEVLPVDGLYGREIVARGRKPSKWDVQYETFKTIEEAIARSREVTDMEYKRWLREDKAKRKAK